MLNTTPGYNALALDNVERCSPYGDSQRPQMAVPTQSVGTRFVQTRGEKPGFLSSEPSESLFFEHFLGQLRSQTE